MEKYTSSLLAQRIKSELNGGNTVFLDKEFEFSDSVVVVTGWVDEYYEAHGGYDEPPYYELISRTADFDSIVISYNDERVVGLDLDGILDIEKMVEEEG